MDTGRDIPMYDFSGYILEALPAGGQSVDLADVLNDVDYRQRMVPSREELNLALAALAASGAITETAARTFRRPAAPGPAAEFTPLTEAEYAEVVAEYHRRFEDALAGANRSLSMRGLDASLKTLYRLSGGRLGIAPEWTDLDATSVGVVVENRIAEAGGSCPPGPDASTFRVAGVPEARRDELRDSIRAALEGHRLPVAGLRLVFEDGSVMAIGGDPAAR